MVEKDETWLNQVVTDAWPSSDDMGNIFEACLFGVIFAVWPEGDGNIGKLIVRGEEYYRAAVPCGDRLAHPDETQCHVTALRCRDETQALALADLMRAIIDFKRRNRGEDPADMAPGIDLSPIDHARLAEAYQLAYQRGLSLVFGRDYKYPDKIGFNLLSDDDCDRLDFFGVGAPCRGTLDEVIAFCTDPQNCTLAADLDRALDRLKAAEERVVMLRTAIATANTAADHDGDEEDTDGVGFVD
jgi:hypothetical protein